MICDCSSLPLNLTSQSYNIFFPYSLFVQHNYHDLINEPDVPPEEVGSEEVKPHAPLSHDAFPMKLHRLLEQIEQDGYGSIISWQPHGRAFLIRDPSLFLQVILPRYFPKVSKLTSIQRQLNLYGFERLTRDGPDEGAYYHEAFLRGRPSLSANRMIRKRVKGTGYKAASNPEGEPDLYSMPFVGDVLSRRKKENQQLETFTEPVLSSFSNTAFEGGLQGQEGGNGYVYNINDAYDEDPGVVTESTSQSQQRASWSSESTDESSGMYSVQSRNTAHPPMPSLNQQWQQATSAVAMQSFHFQSSNNAVTRSFANGIADNGNQDLLSYNASAPDQNLLQDFANFWEQAEAANAGALHRQSSFTAVHRW